MPIYTPWGVALYVHILFVTDDESELKCICVCYKGKIKCMRSLIIHVLLYNYLNTLNVVRV